MPDVLRDLRFGIRILAKSPGFTASAVLLLAIGISANTLIFSVLDAWMLRPLPVKNPQSLVRLIEVRPNFTGWEFPYDLCEAQLPGSGILAEAICQGEVEIPLTDGESTERLSVHLVSPNFFSTLGVAAYRGRVLTADDERARSPSAVLSYSFWARRFARDPSIIGRSINLKGHAFTVVGVLPERFNGFEVDTGPDVRVPVSADSSFYVSKAGARFLFSQVFFRLRDGVSVQTADAAAESLLRDIYTSKSNKLYPNEGSPPIRSRLSFESVSTGVSAMRSQFSPGLRVLMGGVVILLLMACTNVAGLLIARSAARADEIAVRLALGATPIRIIRQLLMEGLLLGVLGGAAGILISRAASPLLIAALPAIRDRAAVLHPLALHIELDLRVLAFSLAVTLIAVVLFALSPAIQSARLELMTILRSSRSSVPRLIARKAIVALQVAICTVLLIGAAVLVKSLNRMRSMDPGFDRDRVVTFTIDTALQGYPEEKSRALSRELLDRVRQLPGVTSASLASRGLMRGTGMKATFAPTGTRIQPADSLNCSLNSISPGYFESMRIAVVAGRDFNRFDGTPSGVSKVIVNRAFAARFFPGLDPIGKQIGSPGPGNLAKPDMEIVGVVNDARYRSLREPIHPIVYRPAVDGFEYGFVLQVRSAQRPELLIAPVRKLLRSLDPELPIVEVHTLKEEVEMSLWQERLLASLSWLFGMIAVVIASLGLYAAIDYAVRSRTREIGVRVAVGAAPATLARMLGTEVTYLVTAGMLIGLGGYAAVTVWIRQTTYGVSPWDPFAIASVTAVLCVVAAFSAAPGIRRAIRIDPAAALRSE